MSRLFDAHTHLQDNRIKERLPQIITAARKAGVCRISCCATSPEDWPAVVGLAEKYPGTVIPSLGIHPWFIDKAKTNILDRLRQLLKTVNAGIGEIGLDFADKALDRAFQERLFVEQLRLARMLDLPVSIHCRRAWGRMLEILKSEGSQYRGVLHSYSGGHDLVAEAVGLGFHLSFSGTLTYDRNKKSRRALAETPFEKILIETDTPDLIPVGAPGKLNEPANLPLVLNTVCEITGLTAEKAAELTWQNASSLFNSPL